ncbi:MAG: hypothetical protein R3247_15805, partial [Rhodothermales bacterium]|nr:hypothetical protein [Rhodothermales bacterium]
LAFLAGRHAPEVLARASLEAMWVPQHPAGADGPYRQFIGLSFFGFEGKGLRVVGHTGSQKGFRAFLYLDPATGAGAAAAVNATGRGGPPDAMALLHILRRRLFDTVFPFFRGTEGERFV